MNQIKLLISTVLLGVLISCGVKPNEEVSSSQKDTPVAQEDTNMGGEDKPVTFRSKAPSPQPAKSIDLGEYKSFEMANGLQVIVVENHKVPKISWQLSLDLDPIVEGDKAGYTSFAGDLLSRGTTTRSKAEIDEAIDFMGASLNTSRSGIYARSLTKHSDDLLTIFSDVLLNPIFPEAEFEKIKKEQLSSLAQSRENPNSIASRVSGALLYGLEHPYGEIESEATVNNVSVNDCKKYYEDYFKPNTAYLIVVGDITPAEAKIKAEKYFSAWKKGPVQQHEYDLPKQPSNTKVAFVHKDGAVQSVIRVGNVVDVHPASEDIEEVRVMNSILGGGVFSGRLMQNLREDKGYTYGARSNLRTDEVVGNFTAFASVRNEVTDSSVTEFMHELNLIRDTKVTQKELDLTKNVMAGGFARSLENPQTIARFALNTAKYGLPADYYQNYLKRLEAVTIDDVQRMAQKYIRPENMFITVVGNKDDVADKLAQFAGDQMVDYFDAFGNKMEAIPEELPDGVTGESVIDDYIVALGGRDKLGSVKNQTQIWNGTMFGSNMEDKRIIVAPDKYYQNISSPQMKVMEQKYNGIRGTMSGMMTQGAVVEMEDDGIEVLKEQAMIFPFLSYKERGIGMELKSVEDYNGKEHYKVEVIYSEDAKILHLYDAETKFLSRMIIPQEEGGTMTLDFSNYKEIDGIFYPHKYILVIPQAPTPMEYDLTSIKTNSEVDMSVFFIE